MKEYSLIANSGLHFKTVQIEINPEEPLVMESGKTLKYTFLEKIDFLDECKVSFGVCSSKDGYFSPIEYIRKHSLFEESSNGLIAIDDSGVPKIKKDTSMAVIESYPSNDPQLISVNSLSSYRIKKEHDVLIALESLLGKWLPMPMYEQDISGQSTGFPNGWCRLRIDKVGERGKDGKIPYRCTWAFDTQLADNAEGGILRPVFLKGSGISKIYTLCNRVDLLFGGFITLPGEEGNSPVSDYLAALFEIDFNNNSEPHKYKFLSYYIYLINYLRLIGAAPKVTLYNNLDKTIPVDMSIDIGNSRTCAVLFEKGDFTKARMLRIRDLSEPWRTYENAFDMRIVFRHADFGGDITQGKDLFQWSSLVRVGEEAKHLIYRSLEGSEISNRSTNYSSPKRYLWDGKLYEDRWEQMVVDDDPTNLKVNPQIYIDGFTDFFDDDGTFLDEPKEIDLFHLGEGDTSCHYSRRSLMTFVMIEILQQARCYINSEKFVTMHGQTDCRRYLRNIIVTSPTAMPIEEQRVLRQAAKNAVKILRKLNPMLPEITVIPDPDKIISSDDPVVLSERGWLYDEAMASQLVYLYAELNQRYRGHVDHFFKIKGHFREEISNKGFEGNALTIGTIDIGAGTTDVMVTAYGQSGMGHLTPIPLYYDSFYTAGDDILHNIIRDVIIEGVLFDNERLGSIGSSLSVRIQKMTPDELLKIPCVEYSTVYKKMIDDIRNAISIDEETDLKRHFTQELMHNFFAEDSAGMSAKDRRCRLDFCTQVSHPMAQFFLELLNRERPSKLYTFEDLFPKEKPSEYLLDHFEYVFGFRFESLEWRYDPNVIGNIVRSTMEPMIKALSVVMYAQHCDILVLSGRPTSLKPLTGLFLKYIPIAPNRLVCLNNYRVGKFFPLATMEGYFQESQKAMVAVGAEIGYLASTQGFNGLVLDFSLLSQMMKSTVKYLGLYDEQLQEIKTPLLTPQNGTATLKGVSVFPCYIGAKQYNSPKYQARPLYAIYNRSQFSQLNIMLQRNFHEDRELLSVEDVTNIGGDTIQNSDIELRLQTLASDGNFWLDKGEFKIDIQEK